MLDIIFFSHAKKSTGFGHAARCAQLYNILKSSRKDLSIAFCGPYTKTARILIKKICKDLVFLDSVPKAKIIFYDRMDNILKPEKFSQKNINKLRKNCLKVCSIFFAFSIAET